MKVPQGVSGGYASATDSRVDGPPVGWNTEYVVDDDDNHGRERVALSIEEIGTYDPEFYTTELIRAATSVLSPCG